MIFLQFLYDLSDRDIEEQCTWNMLFKCSLGLGTEELPPDHLTTAASVSVWGRGQGDRPKPHGGPGGESHRRVTSAKAGLLSG